MIENEAIRQKLEVRRREKAKRATSEWDGVEVGRTCALQWLAFLLPLAASQPISDSGPISLRPELHSASRTNPIWPGLILIRQW
jgi:hypothetical protein